MGPPDHTSPAGRRYRLVSRISHGAMGEVWAADGPQGRVAIKMIPEFLTGDAALLNETSLTVTGSHFGTPAYMSPEAFRDSKSVTTAADVWSLGVIL